VLLHKFVELSQQAAVAVAGAVTGAVSMQAACCQRETKCCFRYQQLLGRLLAVLLQEPNQATAIYRIGQAQHCMRKSQGSAAPMSRFVKSFVP
jgi:hypothetical protein